MELVIECLRLATAILSLAAAAVKLLSIVNGPQGQKGEKGRDPE